MALARYVGNSLLIFRHLMLPGADFSHDRIGQARKNFEGVQNFRAVTADIYQLPFPDDHFDLIYSRFVFEYLKDPVAAARELYRICKPGGKLVLQDLDGQFSFYPEPKGVPDLLALLKSKTGFDPNVGRKLFSFGRAAHFDHLHAQVELYHNVFGKIDEYNYGLWQLKLSIAGEYLVGVIGKAATENIVGEVLALLKSENSIAFSNLFTLAFIKPPAKD